MPSNKRAFVGTVALMATGIMTAGIGFTSTADASGSGDKPRPAARNAPVHQLGKPNFDVRSKLPDAKVSAATNAARIAMRGDGKAKHLEENPATGAVRVLAAEDGFLTGPDGRPADKIVLDYVRNNADAFGLDARGVASLRLENSYDDSDGTQHLRFSQRVHGLPVFGAGLKAAVTKDGRIAVLTDGPVPGLELRSARPNVSADKAVSSALRNGDANDTNPGRAVGHDKDTESTTRFAHGHRAALMVFPTSAGARLGWLVNAFASSTGAYIDMVDASSAEVLTRQNTVASDSDATGQAWQYYPSTYFTSPGVGTQAVVHFPVNNTGATLAGNNAHVYADVLDNIEVPGGAVPASAEIPASTPGANPAWNYPAVLNAAGAAGNCSVQFSCTWNQTVGNSFAQNKRQNGTQVYYYVNRFHDWLKNNASIGFTEAKGNFQLANGTAGGKGGDAVQAQILDGASTSNQIGGAFVANGGFPDGNHVDNANMATQQDGIPPQMQMYLFGNKGDGYSIDGNGGDEASIIYHEYAHGLSNRLVTDPNGIPALSSFQSNAMGEAWSDWYAMDFLMAWGYDVDTATVGDVNVGYFISGGDQSALRTESMDCPYTPNDSQQNWCNGGYTPHYGGYSYGDLGKIIEGGPEVHADGEIWGQTLWQLRQRVGRVVAAKLVTLGLEISPSAPSMLDARNAILQADQIAYGSSHKAVLWSVFAQRGFGFFARTDNGDDVTPTQNFAQPVACTTTTCTTVTGLVTDPYTGAVVPGVRVGLEGHNSNLANDLAGLTDSTGRYRINNVPNGRSYGLQFAKAGYLYITKPIAIATNAAATTTIANQPLLKDYAAQALGGKVLSFTKPDYTTFGCGPAKALDVLQTSGWGSDSPANNQSGVTGARNAVFHLSQKTNIKQIRIDVGAVCGDPAEARLKNFVIRTRTSATAPWVSVVTNTTQRAGGVYTTFAPTAGVTGVVDVQLIMQSNAGQPDFMDMAELAVLGLPG